jgi:hypothetical protein
MMKNNFLGYPNPNNGSTLIIERFYWQLSFDLQYNKRVCAASRK